MGAGAAMAQGLPGGATSISETHGDWTVACHTAEGAALCAITQTQVSSENRQRVLAIELKASEGGNVANGLLVLPFGLRLDSGVRLAIDDGATREPLRFSTCLPVGCLVPLRFDEAIVTELRSGRELSAKAIANDGGQEMAFSISLSGFASALARLTEIGSR